MIKSTYRMALPMPLTDTIMATILSNYQDDLGESNLGNTCSQIEGKIFTSIQQFPRFRSSELASNTIEFKDGEFCYSYGDVEEYGSITCEGNNIFGSTSRSSRIFTGEYNPNTKHLVWEEIEYLELNDTN